MSTESNGSKTPQQLKMPDGTSIKYIIAPIQAAATSTPIYPQPVPTSFPSPFSNPFLTVSTTCNDTARPFVLPTPELSISVFRKPVIYIFSQEKMDVSVSVSLTPQWGFCALYPVVHIQYPRSSRLHQQIEWNVESQSDGSLKEKNTGLEIAYMFWAAIVNTESPSSPPQSPIEGHPISSDCFNPVSCDVTPEDSVLLAVDDLPAYWLPSFLKHTHIALRFMPQASYDGAAPMEVNPRSNVATRVFMLFKGVLKMQGTLKWDKAVERSRDAVGFWRDVIGTQLELSEENPRLRVLEWGGMEIH
ncbi:hypothetical protein L218DRAFT_1002550 [Marasmius fiardii PR-910]|nr:hypothetical protein L218DRAFT_1002550 [Marasmius fiardii PR-910]